MNWERVMRAANLAAKRTGVRQVVMSHERWPRTGWQQEWCWHFFAKGSDDERSFRSTRRWISQ